MSRRSGSRFRVLSKGRTKQRGQMNKTETKYAEQLAADPDVAQWWFEPFSLRLTSPDTGQPARYTPDFLILLTDGTTYVDDVKGTGLDDPASLVRLKCAAELFPLWIFRRAKQRTAKAGGGWEIVEV